MRHRGPIHTLQSCLFLIHLIITFHLCLCLSYVFVWGFSTKLCMYFSSLICVVHVQPISYSSPVGGCTLGTEISRHSYLGNLLQNLLSLRNAPLFNSDMILLCTTCPVSNWWFWLLIVLVKSTINGLMKYRSVFFKHICVIHIVAYRPVAMRWLCKQQPFLGSGSANTFPLLGSRFLIM
jgi:hypothetical protein